MTSVRLAVLALVVTSVVGASISTALATSGSTDGLVLNYSFEARHHNTFPDVSGHGLDGALVAPQGKALVPSVAGYGKALRLQGDRHQYVDVPQDSVLDLDTFTIAAWVRYTGVENDQTFGRWEVLEKAGAYWLNVRTSGHVRAGGFFGGCTSASWQFLDSRRTLAANRWYHLAATYDGASLRIYVNGKASGSMSVSGTTCASKEPLAVGAKNNPSQGLLEAFWDGRLDEIRLYDDALTRKAIAALATRDS